MAVNLSDKSCASQPTQNILESPSTPSVISSQYVATPPNPLSTSRLRLTAESGQSTQPLPPLMAADSGDTNGNNNASRGRNRGRGRRSQRSQRPHERLQRNLDLFETMFSTRSFKRFFQITPNGDTNLSMIDTIRANNDLEVKLGGEPKKVTETRDGSLLVEVKNETQSQRIKNITRLHNSIVTVTEHATLNSIKGTIRYNNRPGYSDEQICAELVKYNATNVKKINRATNLQSAATLYIVTFDNCTLPKEVKIGWTKLEVREFIPRPRRCFQCQRWGHSAGTCREEEGTCMNCGGAAHGRNCTEDASCANCELDHPANSTECLYYRIEEMAQQLKYREKMSYFEAKKRATNVLTKSYAGTVAREIREPVRNAQRRTEQRREPARIPDDGTREQQAPNNAPERARDRNAERTNRVNQSQGNVPSAGDHAPRQRRESVRTIIDERAVDRRSQSTETSNRKAETERNAKRRNSDKGENEENMIATIVSYRPSEGRDVRKRCSVEGDAGPSCMETDNGNPHPSPTTPSPNPFPPPPYDKLPFFLPPTAPSTGSSKAPSQSPTQCISPSPILQSKPQRMLPPDKKKERNTEKKRTDDMPVKPNKYNNK